MHNANNRYVRKRESGMNFGKIKLPLEKEGIVDRDR